MLYYQADIVHGGALPVPVHFLMDEFANVALPDEFDKLLSTMRSRLIFVSIIIQNLAQIKGLYKDSWESIVGNCDTLYYLGGNVRIRQSQRQDNIVENNIFQKIILVSIIIFTNKKTLKDTSFIKYKAFL